MSDVIEISVNDADEIVIFDDDGLEEVIIGSDAIVVLEQSGIVNQSDVQGLVPRLENIESDIADTQNLAETNQLNIGLKADQLDLEATNAQVETNRLAILTKADEAYVNALETSVANRVRFDVATQALTLIQQQNARTNIGAEAAGTAAALVAAITPAAIGAATAAQGAKADTALQSGDVAPVALSGSYTALIDKPTLLTLASLLTGLTAGTDAAITAADSLITAFAKLQAQITANAQLLAPVPRKLLSGWYKSGYWYDSVWPYPVTAGTTALVGGAVRISPFTPNTAMTIQAIGINITAAAAAGGTLQLGIYADAGDLNIGAPLFRSAQIAADTTGEKIASVSLTLTAGVTYWLAVFASLQCTATAIPFSPVGHSTAAAPVVSMRLASTAVELPASVGTVSFTATQSPRIMLQAV